MHDSCVLTRIGTGSESLTQSWPTWRLAYGGPEKMLRRAVQALLIEKLRERLVPCMRSGRLISTDLSFERTSRAGRLFPGRIKLYQLKLNY